MTVHIGVDADAGLMHAVAGTAANVNDVTQGHALMHGQETNVYADAGYQGVAKRDDTHNMTLRPLQRVALAGTDSNVWAGTIANGVVMDRSEGTPSGGPVSRILAFEFTLMRRDSFNFTNKSLQ